MKKLKYIANLRLPTDKAHSIQIMKMCEAFASQGIDVELIIPDKRNNTEETEVFEYYNIKTPFKIRKISGTDFLGKTRNFGKVFYWIDLLVFLFSLYFTTHFEEGSIIYSRDPILFIPFLNLNREYRLQAEIHSLPARRYLFLKLLKFTKGIVVVTRYLKEMLIEHGFSEEKIIVAPDAVDLKAFDIIISKKEARDRLGLSENKILVGYVGMLKTMGMGKGIDVALASLKGLRPETELVLIGGDQKDIDSYKKLAKELGVHERVQFTGRVPYSSIPLYLKACDVLIAPFPETEHYKYFMSPLKLFEYMASGVPIIASDLPSLREIVDESMVNFVIPDDPKDLSRIITDVLNCYNDALNKAQKSLRGVQAYSWQKRAQNILSFIR